MQDAPNPAATPPLALAPDATPLRVVIIDSQDLVVTGALTLLCQFPDRILVVDEASATTADVVLYGVDDDADEAAHDPALHALLRSSAGTVIAFGLRQESPAAQLAAGCGVHGFAHKQLTAQQLVERIDFLHRRRQRLDDPRLPAEGECHPGVGVAGLSGREVEVLSMIARGMSNRDIAETLFLSINSVKTYVGSAYRKIGVNRRSQAVAWARRHGLGSAPEDGAGVVPPLDAEGA
jgi:two-component system, NarL family, response regulator LiaR